MHSHAMNQQESTSRNILACLGDSSRFRLVLSLLERDRCVTELADEVGLSQSCTTRHLQYLEREGLVRGARQGKRVVFRLRYDRARVRELLAWVTAAGSENRPDPVSGADVHTEGPVPAVKPKRAAPRRRPPAPQPGTSWPQPEAAAPAPVPADGAASLPEADRNGPTRGADMEDWLL